ncbi:MAG: WG repeat-containing protein [Pseudomonadota bacterium]
MKKTIIALVSAFMLLCLPLGVFAESYTEIAVTGLGSGYYIAEGNFSEGMCAVSGVSDEYGFVNSEGKLVIGCKFDMGGFDGASSAFSDGVARVVINDKICFIDKTGKVVLSTQYTYSAHSNEYMWSDVDRGNAAFYEGRACIVGNNGKWGFIDKTGKAVTAFEFVQSSKFHNGKAFIDNSEGRNMIDINGQKLFPKYYDDIQEKEDGSWYCYNWTYYGTRSPYSFFGQPHVVDNYDIYNANFGCVKSVPVNEAIHEILPYNAVAAAAAKVVKFGLDANRYSNVSDLGNGILQACLQDKYVSGRDSYVLIDAATGKEFVDSPFGAVKEFNADGVAVVTKGKDENGAWITKMGAVDSKGNLLVPFKYNFYYYANTFNNGLILAERQSDRKMVLLKLLGAGTKEAASSPTYNAKPLLTKIIVKGKSISANAYNISGNNFYKLKDLQYVCANTGSAFSASWNEKKQAIELASGKPETSGNISTGALAPKNAAPSSAALYKDGEKLSLTTYNIDGYTYFKLRDIGDMFGFEPIWDENDSSIILKFVGEE